MKKILTAIIFVALFTSVQSQSLYNQIVDYLQKEGGYSLSTAKYNYVNKGEKFYNYKTFSAGLEYAIVAYSENTAVDIDLYLYKDGVLELKDAKPGKWATLHFKNWTTQQMKIVIKNYNYSGSAKCEVLVFYR